MRVLVLGGTAEARQLAPALVGAGHDVVTSLAGRVSAPRLPEAGAVRVGGFGGVDGLVAWSQEERIDAVVDATHPYAARMGAHALAACARLGLPLVRLARPGWATHPLAGDWHWVDDLDAARGAAERLGGTPMLTTGRQTLGHFLGPWSRRRVVVRVVEPLAEAPPPWVVVRDRGPYTVAGETSVLRQHEIGVLLTKDSGGSYTEAKLEAAHRLGVPVVVVRRPERGQVPHSVTTTAAAVAALETLADRRPAARRSAAPGAGPSPNKPRSCAPEE